MSSSTPKTGRAQRMRAWMKEQKKLFTVETLYEGIGMSPGRRQTLGALRDFVRRGEVEKHKRRQNFYSYNAGWRRGKKGILDKRAYKAMYLLGTFTVSDVIRLADIPSRIWVSKITWRLRKRGMICAVGRRLCAHGAGAEKLYHVADRDRFRLEVMR